MSSPVTAALNVRVVDVLVETLMEYHVVVDPDFFTTKLPESSKSPPLMAAMSVGVVPAIAPRSVATPELSIRMRFPAVRPLVAVVAIPYMKPS